MKKVILMALALLVILTCVSITACGGGKEKETTPALTKTQGQNPTGTTAKPTKPSGNAEGWGDMPIYPGATQIAKTSTQGEEDGKTVTWDSRVYETGDNMDKVADFYKGKMPDNGWDELMWSEVQDGFMGQYQKEDEDLAATVSISENEEGVTSIYLIRVSTE